MLRAVACPADTPWLCDGRTCIDKFKYNCCRGGYICRQPNLCVRNPREQIQCG
jgi:hypothetical protein